VGTGIAVVALPSFDDRLPRGVGDLDRITGGQIRTAVRRGDFSGERDQTVLFYASEGPNRVVLVGMGERGDVDINAIRRAAAVGARVAVKAGAETMTFSAISAGRKVSPEDLGRGAVEGAALGGWTFEELRTERKSKADLTRVTVLVDEAARTAAARGRRIGDAVAAGHLLARGLQMLPGNFCPPSHLASVARSLGRRYGHRVSVLRRSQLEREGLNALLAVAQGSAEEPRLITLEYRGGRGAPVVLVGKGVTFDSGGISIKPALHMEEMKFDMSGAAAVLGTFETLGRLKPRINVVGVIPSTENLPSGTAVKPGDVVETHLGKTVEVINTDAEGRLILCDALSYARKFKPACLVDVATLTGAIVIGLGHTATGLMGNDDTLVDELREAGERSGERCWPLPLWDEYRELIKSTTADIKNVGGRAAGSITAGWFLREFVDDDTPWAHLDIAGTAWHEGDAACPDGPTAVGVRLFSEFVLSRAG